VPPQQKDLVLAEAERLKLETKLPREIVDMVTKEAFGGLMELEEAKRLRLDLMNERTIFDQTVEKGFEEYNLCEH
jgi:hypothetical protein